VFFSIVAFSQNNFDDALRQGNAEAIAVYLNHEIEFCIFDKEDIFDKKTATAQLNKFFQDYRVKAYKQVHVGTSKGKQSNYSIGNLITDKGNFRVYIYFNLVNGKKHIQELRIEEA
jgi:hypothetical protein